MPTTSELIWVIGDNVVDTIDDARLVAEFYTQGLKITPE